MRDEILKLGFGFLLVVAVFASDLSSAADKIPIVIGHRGAVAFVLNPPSLLINLPYSKAPISSSRT
ncbi:MAG: hypothetical protein ACREYE_33960 [Gammaproteobacteria bacterium]